MRASEKVAEFVILRLRRYEELSLVMIGDGEVEKEKQRDKSNCKRSRSLVDNMLLKPETEKCTLIKSDYCNA